MKFNKKVIILFCLILVGFVFILLKLGISYGFIIPSEHKYDTVDEMLDADVVSGDYIETAGFHKINDQGGSVYSISTTGNHNGSTVIELSNGLYANLMINESMNIMQYGLVNAPNLIDYGNIENIYNEDKLYLALTSSVTELNFPENGLFFVKDEMVIERNDLIINGNNSSILVDNNFIIPNHQAYVIKFWGCDNIAINHLIMDNSLQTINLKMPEDIREDYSGLTTQIGIFYSSNIIFESCNFYGPGPKMDEIDHSNEDVRNEMFNSEEFLATSEIDEFQLLDIYTGWENVTVNNCGFYSAFDGAISGGGGFRDIWGSGGVGGVFTNNTVAKIGHDEVFAFGWVNALHSDILVENNTFSMYDGPNTSSAIGVTLGTQNMGQVATGVIVRNNVFNIESTFRGITVNKVSDDFIFSDNIINISKGQGYAELGEQSLTVFAVNNDVALNIENNTFNVDSSYEGYEVYRVFDGNINSINNNINIDGDILDTVYYKVNSVKGDNINSTGKINYLSYNVDNIKNIVVNVADYILCMMRLYDINTIEDVRYEFNNNMITTGKEIAISTEKTALLQVDKLYVNHPFIVDFTGTSVNSSKGEKEIMMNFTGSITDDFKLLMPKALADKYTAFWGFTLSDHLEVLE